MRELKILIVDDETDINDLLADYLGLKGYKNITALTTGKEAIGFIQSERPDVVFLDIMLADEIDGMKVLEDGRAASPETKFIMMSAYKEDYGQKAREMGAYAFLGKPVKIPVIREILKELEKS